jgi:hypothetical protein
MNIMTHENCNGCCPGAAGPQGPQGNLGIQGPVGPQGQPGQTGAQGNAGPAGAQGIPGLQGSQGIPGKDGNDGQPGPRGDTGPAGVTGAQGQAGQTGSVGPMGPAGPMGLQGLQGVPGTCVECKGDDSNEFAEAYSQVAQNLSPSLGVNQAGGTVLLENLIIATANIDASLSASQGKFKINLAGWYDVAAGMTGTLNPIPAPLPVWTLSLFLNGVIVPGSTFSNIPLSPAQGSNEITADTFIYCNVGDILTLANTSTANVFLSAPTLGTNAQTNSAYLKIQLLRAGAK